MDFKFRNALIKAKYAYIFKKFFDLFRFVELDL